MNTQSIALYIFTGVVVIAFIVTLISVTRSGSSEAASEAAYRGDEHNYTNKGRQPFKYSWKSFILATLIVTIGPVLVWGVATYNHHKKHSEPTTQTITGSTLDHSELLGAKSGEEYPLITTAQPEANPGETYFSHLDVTQTESVSIRLNQGTDHWTISLPISKVTFEKSSTNEASVAINLHGKKDRSVVVSQTCSGGRSHYRYAFPTRVDQDCEITDRSIDSEAEGSDIVKLIEDNLKSAQIKVLDGHPEIIFLNE